MTGAVHLTFDDGPDEIWTARVLEELARARAQATFFPIGERVAAHPDVVARVRGAGHQVEMHCMRHVVHSRCWRATAEEDADACLSELARLRITPRHWRPPGGGMAPWTPDVAAKRGLRLAGWSADTHDWSGNTVEAMLEHVAPAIEEGAVVLMHDALGPGARREGCARTVELIEPLVALIRERGLEPDVLGEGSPFQGQGFTVFSPRSTGRPAYRPRPSEPELRVAVTPESELTGPDRAAIVRLIATEFGPIGAQYAERGWRTIEPVSRVVVRDADVIVAQGSLVPLESEPAVQLYGLADAVVASAHRGRGIGARISNELVAEAWRRGAEMILSDSIDLERALTAIGFEPVPRFNCYYERGGACHCRRHWLAAFRSGPPGGRLRLAEGDF